jgi:hypothetical protein
MYGTVEYNCWNSMMVRCRSTKSKRYGGRGIKVCERWQTFENFYADMGPRPTENHSLDRINNEGNYEPSNCRWATWTQQARNKSNCHVLTVGSESFTIAEWAERTGIGKTTIRERIRRGWSPERATSTPT